MPLSKKKAPPPPNPTGPPFRLSPKQKGIIETALRTSLEEVLNQSAEWRLKLLGDGSKSVGRAVSYLEIDDVQERFGHQPSYTAYIVFSNGRSVRIRDVVFDPSVGHSRDKPVKNRIPDTSLERIASTRRASNGGHAIGLVEAVLLLVVHVYRSIEMAKKSYASSRPEKLVSMKAEDIFSKPLAPKQRAMLKRLKNRPDSEIDYSDIPELTDEQLAEFKPAAKVLVAARTDRDVYNWLRQFGEGYSTRINGILRAVMEKSAQ